MAEFAFNNKVHTAIKSSLFQVNYRREPRMGFDIRKKRKNEKTEDVVATTCRNGTHSLLTSAKLSTGLSSSGDYKKT